MRTKPKIETVAMKTRNGIKLVVVERKVTTTSSPLKPDQKKILVSP